MSFTVVDVPQRSADWFQARLGRVTGSCAHEMLAQPKSGKGELAGRRNLRVRLALERLTGRSLDVGGYQSKAMEQGIEREVDACATYEALTGRLLSSCGFLAHADLYAGVSLDGYVGDYDGIIEVKSPTPAVHLDYLRSGRIPADYFSQVTHGLWLTGAAWCDWLSYNPDFPEGLQVKLVRVTREQVDIGTYEAALKLFLEEVHQEVESVAELARKAAA